MTSVPSQNGSLDPLHIGETIKGVWEKPLPNALLWPLSLMWKNVRPAVQNTLEWGKGKVVDGIRFSTRTAVNTALHIPLPIPGKGR